MHMIMGDAHGDFDYLKWIIETHPQWETITIVGDMGLGFPGNQDIPFRTKTRVFYIRGNHDNPEFIKNTNCTEWRQAGWHYIPDGTLHFGRLYIGGGKSIDVRQRTPGLDWWPDEEIGFEEQEAILKRINEYEGVIHTIITHEAPRDLYPIIHPDRVRPSANNNTSVFLNRVLGLLLTRGQPRQVRWIFGHHHKTLDTNLYGINFRCLAEMHTLDHTPLGGTGDY